MQGAGFSVALGLVLTASTSVLAQGVDMTECVGLKDSDARKQCFAEIYSRSAPDPAPQPIEADPELPQGWTETSSVDEMRGLKSFYVLTPSIPPLRKMQFPYHNTTMRLAIACDSEGEWAYFVFSESPNIIGAELKSDYSLIDAQVLWGDEILRHEFTQDHGSRFMMFRDNAEAIRRVERNPRMIAEFTWYGSGRTQFGINLTGGADALQYLRHKCR